MPDVIATAGGAGHLSQSDCPHTTLACTSVSRQRLRRITEAAAHLAPGVARRDTIDALSLNQALTTGTTMESDRINFRSHVLTLHGEQGE